MLISWVPSLPILPFEQWMQYLPGILLGAVVGMWGTGANVCVSVLVPTRLSRQDAETREDAGYASLELPGDSTLSLPTLDTEETSDDLISPYASFSSKADRPTPLLSGWLDKLSPQG